MDVIPFDRELFDLLVCPESKAPLKYVDGALVSTDGATRRKYPVADGIPIMLLEESEVLAPEAWQAAMDADGPVGAGGSDEATERGS